MYDVVYLDEAGQQVLIARSLAKEQACGLALEESRRRHVGRMFLAGSEHDAPRGAQVLIVESRTEAA